MYLVIILSSFCTNVAKLNTYLVRSLDIKSGFTLQSISVIYSNMIHVNLYRIVRKLTFFNFHVICRNFAGISPAKKYMIFQHVKKTTKTSENLKLRVVIKSMKIHS